MKSEKANIAELKDSQPNLLHEYRILLKSPIKPHALFHPARTLASSSHKAPPIEHLVDYDH